MDNTKWKVLGFIEISVFNKNDTVMLRKWEVLFKLYFEKGGTIYEQ